MGLATPSSSGTWPVKPGLRLIPEAHLDQRPEEEIVSSLQTYRPVTGERNVWAFWHSGFSNAPPWVQRTVVNWVRRLPTWSIRVLDSVPGSSSHFHRYLAPTFLPDALNNNAMTGPHARTHSSDLVRLPLVYIYGGVWMDVGTLLFRDLDDICWSKIEDPESPYEIAGFSVPHGDGSKESTPLNGFIAAKKGNEFIRRWHEIFLEVWKGASSSTGMHAHPLLKDLPRYNPTAHEETLDRGLSTQGIKAGSEPGPQEPDVPTKVPWSGAMDLEVQQKLADYTVQFACFDRLRLLEDPSDGFSGPDYLADHGLFFDGLQESLLAHQLTGWDGMQEFHFLATKKQEGSSDPRYLEAERFAESIVRDSCKMSVSHSQLLGVAMLGNLWEQPGNEDADRVEGTFAEYLRYASVYLEQSRELQSQRMELSARKRLRVGLLEVEQQR